MKITQAQIDQIKDLYNDLSDKHSLLNLINVTGGIIYGSSFKPLKLKTLSYYANPAFSQKRYRTFRIKKKSGKERVIHAPVASLKIILRLLNVVFQIVVDPSASATGFVPGKSIVDNAKLHQNQNYVFNIDLKDFFHSFDKNRVKMGLILPPFDLGLNREKLAFFLASLVTHPFEVEGEIKAVLPQGSPTSPTLTNILCIDLDRRLKGLADRFGAHYSRYADDITFSSPHNIYRKNSFQKELKRIISEDQGLIVNKDKVRLQKNPFRQEATGLVVNNKVNVRKSYVKQLRMWLYYWEKYGYSKANDIFLKDYMFERGHVKKGLPKMEHVIGGKLRFLKMVKGEVDSTYLKLESRFLSLIESQEFQKDQEVNLDKIVDTILNSGLDEGISLFETLKNT